MSNIDVRMYLFFNGNCEEAMAFYQKKLGATVEFSMRYKESPEPPPPGMVPAGFEDKIMHAAFRIGDTQLLASDDCSGRPKAYGGFAVALTVLTEADGERLFAGLSDGGKVSMPMRRTFFSPKFGMLTDRFGIMWMVMVKG